MEEDAKNEKCCVQVLRFFITDADNEIERLEENLMSLQNELAWTEHENWPEICCNGLTEKINQLDVAVNTLKSGHADDAEVQLLLDSGPAEKLHEIVKGLYKDHCQDAHGQDLLAISLVRSPDLGVVSCVPYHSERMILSDTLDDKVTGDEDVRQSQLVATDTCQILNPFLSKEENTTLKENVFSDDCRLAIIKGGQHIASETKVKKPFLSKGSKNIPSETKEVSITVKENVCSDDHRLAIIKSQLIAKNTGQILNPFSSKRNGNIASDAKEICHRDLKLENTLLDGNPSPRLKICDFGYSKSAILHSQPKSTVGTPAYIAPEVLSRKEYDGKIADVWSCGVTLYVMLVGAYPFEEPEDPRNFRKTIGRIIGVQYSIPDYVRISAECRNLLSRIFVADPAKRVTIPEIKQNPWFLKNMPKEIIEAERKGYVETKKDQPSQSVEEIMRIIQEARIPGQGSKVGDGTGQAGTGSMNMEDDEEIDVSGEYENV